MKVVQLILWASRKGPGLGLPLLFLLGVAQAGHAGEFFKCTDSEGKIHISNTQCGGEVKELKTYHLEDRPEIYYERARSAEARTRRMEDQKRNLKKKERALQRKARRKQEIREYNWNKAKEAMETRGECIFPEDTSEGQAANLHCRRAVRNQRWAEARDQLHTDWEKGAFDAVKREKDIAWELQQQNNMTVGK